MRPEFYTGKDGNYNSIPDISWFDETGKAPDWGKLDQFLALRMDGSKAETEADRDDNDFLIMFNSGLRDQLFAIAPPASGKQWFRVLDTGLPGPEAVSPAGRPLESQDHYPVKARSMVLFLS
jgi:glycogen operon protein